MYGFKTWSVTMREEHRLRVFENRVLRKILGKRGNRKHYIKRSFPLIICIKTGPGGGEEEGRFSQGYCLSSILFNPYNNYFTKNLLKVLETSK